MKIKLIDVDCSEAQEEITGTCELCFNSMYCDNPYYIFELENGEKLRLAGFEWDWGDYDEVEIGNIVDFGDWIAKQEFPDDTEFDYNWLWEVVQDYNSTVAYIGWHDMNGNTIFVDSEVKVIINGKEYEGSVDSYDRAVVYDTPSGEKYIGEDGTTFNNNVVVIKAHTLE